MPLLAPVTRAIRRGLVMPRLCRVASPGRLARQVGRPLRDGRGNGVPRGITQGGSGGRTPGGVAWVVAAFLWEGGDDPVELGLFWPGAALITLFLLELGTLLVKRGLLALRLFVACALPLLFWMVVVLRRLVGVRRRRRVGDRGSGGRSCSRWSSWRGGLRSAPPSEETPSSPRSQPPESLGGGTPIRGWALWRSPPTGRHARGVTRSRRDDQPAHLTARPAGDRRRRRHERLRDGAVQAARPAGHRGRHLHARHVLGAADGARGGAGRAGPQHPRRPVRGVDQGRAARPDVRVRPRGAARRGRPAARPLLRAALPLLALRSGRGVGPRPLGRAARALDAHHGQGQERRARRG